MRWDEPPKAKIAPPPKRPSQFVIGGVVKAIRSYTGELTQAPECEITISVGGQVGIEKLRAIESGIGRDHVIISWLKS